METIIVNVASGLVLAAIAGLSCIAVWQNRAYRSIHDRVFNFGTVVYIAYCSFWVGVGYADNASWQSSRPLIYGFVIYISFVAYINIIDYIVHLIDKEKATKE